jgi:putative Holliday junction resolvase
MTAPSPNNLLALDVGTKRIGVALASSIARMPHPLMTLDADAEDLLTQLAAIIKAEDVGLLVVGLPRGLEGQETAQTTLVRDFAASLAQFQLPVAFQDEALTSRKAEAELEARGRPYAKGDIDALAATYILEDYLLNQPETRTT